jgi:hypothetical protein
VTAIWTIGSEEDGPRRTWLVFVGPSGSACPAKCGLPCAGPTRAGSGPGSTCPAHRPPRAWPPPSPETNSAGPAARYPGQAADRRPPAERGNPQWHICGTPVDQACAGPAPEPRTDVHDVTVRVGRPRPRACPIGNPRPPTLQIRRSMQRIRPVPWYRKPQVTSYRMCGSVAVIRCRLASP